MRTLILGLLIFILSSESWSYGLTGLWHGTGMMYFADSVNQPQMCDMRIRINHQPDSFQVLESQFKCGLMNIKNKNQTALQIVNQQLIFQNQPIGFINQYNMNSSVALSDGRQQNYKMRLSSDLEKLSYFDYIQWTSQFTTTIQAQLFKADME